MENNFDEKLEEVKEILKSINKNTSKEELNKMKQQFKDVIRDADPVLIAMAENELIKEGHSIDDIMKACDLHLELFKDAIRNPNLKLPENHPITQFQNDHKIILDLMEKFLNLIRVIKNKNGFENSKEEFNLLKELSEKLLIVENHNVRQENTLFPILEKHGIEQPPAIMWHEHTEMKEIKKQIIKLINEAYNMGFENFIKSIEKLAIYLLEKFASHTQKEENILYLTALKVITDDEWKDIKEECDNLGYFSLNI